MDDSRQNGTVARAFSHDAANGNNHEPLRRLGTRVRRLRREAGKTRAQVARDSGLSVRFLARIEAGDGNVSVMRLYALAEALGTRPDALLRPAPDRRDIVSVVGMRGAGKSTVGALLAARLGVPFVEADAEIRLLSGLPSERLFELHGEPYYRKLERQVLRRILDADAPFVLAAAGGVVNEPANWEMLLERTYAVWLKARPEDHWNRVLGQGDTRPMADNPRAMNELREILGERERAYARAELTVDTSDDGPDEVAARIEAALADARAEV